MLVNRDSDLMEQWQGVYREDRRVVRRLTVIMKFSYLSGWKMRDNQGGVYWRQGYVKLSRFPKLTQIRFRFMVSPKPEPNFPVTRGNVSIDDVRLICEKEERISVNKDVCAKRKLPTAGCLHPAIQPTVKGLSCLKTL